MDNKKSQHRRSVETLGVSGYDDRAILQEIRDLIEVAYIGEQPYKHNALIRFYLKLDEYFHAQAKEGKL